MAYWKVSIVGNNNIPFSMKLKFQKHSYIIGMNS